jgi:hypothetical protein
MLLTSSAGQFLMGLFQIVIALAVRIKMSYCFSHRFQYLMCTGQGVNFEGVDCSAAPVST